jgi:hypothetical protein
MAQGQTVGARSLTPQDEFVIKKCSGLSEIFMSFIKDDEGKKDFKDKFGKTSLSRDAGAGRGAGKLQRDALCTRGTTAKSPISNRNLRWHPLVAASTSNSKIHDIEEIKIDSENRLIYFIVKDSSGAVKQYSPSEVYKLDRRYAVTKDHWKDFNQELAEWQDADWTRNSCIIPVSEACEWYDSVQTFVGLGISILGEFYGVKTEPVIEKSFEFLTNASNDSESMIETNFINKLGNYNLCPVCLEPLSSNLDKFRKEKRQDNWQASWKQNKRKEGEDSSIQVMHVNPLNEKSFMHTAANVRYGHRWCNVAMTDHSLAETLDFMVHVVRMHNRI